MMRHAIKAETFDMGEVASGWSPYNHLSQLPPVAMIKYHGNSNLSKESLTVPGCNLSQRGSMAAGLGSTGHILSTARKRSVSIELSHSLLSVTYLLPSVSLYPLKGPQPSQSGPPAVETHEPVKNDL